MVALLQPQVKGSQGQAQAVHGAQRRQARRGQLGRAGSGLIVAQGSG